MEKKMKELEERYRRLFETAQDGILILNFETAQITDVNSYLIALLGYSKNEFLNKKLWEVGPFKNIKVAKEAFKTLQDTGYVRYEDLPLETKDGRSVAVEFVCNSYIAGETLVIQCNIRDITERKKLDAIKETERFLKEERIKIESIADATHELRTPIAIIKGNVDLAFLAKEKNPKAPIQALKAIDHEIKHLSSILSDLTLITSRVWELKDKLVYDKVNLSNLIDAVIERCRSLAHKKRISITKKNIPNIVILGDKVYLEKMLMNLVKNSIIYGHEKGHTVIEVKKSKKQIEILVCDDGIGISNEDAPHVFERFYRAEKSRNSEGNNTGLGLAIVKWIVELHGGTVSVKKNIKKGSIFIVTLPL